MSYAFFPILNSKDVESRDIVIAHLQAITKQTRNNEPRNSSYYFFTPADESSNSIYGFEVYETKQDLEVTHMASSEFKALFNDIPNILSDSGVFRHFDLVGGFVSKPDTPQNVTDGIISIAQVTTKSGMRDTLVAGITEYANTHAKEEKDTLTYAVCTSQENENLIFVFSVYPNKEAYESHVNSDSLKSLFAKAGEHLENFDRNVFKYVCGFLTK